MLCATCPSPTVDQPATHIEARPPTQLRPRVLVGPLPLLVSLGGRAGCRQARHRGPLAPRRLPPVLTMEVALRQPLRWRRLPGDQTAHQPDGRVQRGLGRAQNSRRIAQARHRHRRAKRVPLHAAQATDAALANLAHLPGQPCWLAQIVDAFPEDTAPRFMIRDRDGIFGDQFRRRVQGLDIEEILTAPRSPWQNPYAERLVGSVRRECLDHVIVLGERHLGGILKSYFAYYPQVTDASVSEEGHAGAEGGVPARHGQDRGATGGGRPAPPVRAPRRLTGASPRRPLAEMDGQRLPGPRRRARTAAWADT